MAFAFVLLAEEYGRKALIRERYFAERKCALDTYDDVALMRKFRFPRGSILEIMEMCQSLLVRKTRRNHALPVHTQVLAALRFYAKGLFQEDAGDIVGISQPCVSRSLKLVSKILAKRVPDEVVFPSTDLEIYNNKMGFYKFAKFPNTLGLVDGSHVLAKPPSGLDEQLFVCRKGGHSINVQIICNPDMLITSFVCKWPGSTHDSFIWKNSELREKFMTHPPNGHLIGDSGYGTEPWLLTPFKNPTSAGQLRYNDALTKTRYKVECTIGLWKSVFRCVDRSGGTLLYSPEMACSIISATIVLHNMRRKLKLPEDKSFVPEILNEPEPVCDSDLNDNELTIQGNLVRQRIVDRYF